MKVERGTKQVVAETIDSTTTCLRFDVVAAYATFVQNRLLSSFQSYYFFKRSLRNKRSKRLPNSCSSSPNLCAKKA